MKKIKKLLVANRGEIAIRIFRTCREMGIRTVGVFSDADREALHTRAADEAVSIGPAPSRESYLKIDKIIDAAKRVGADAIHPGYGFLSENGDFAEACEKAGLVFIGPSTQCIRLMGDKIRAKELMVKAGVPVVPSEGYPLLVKAAAGGGGRGMRIVRKESELQSAMETAKREAERAFGNGELLLERYLEPARHIEVQVFGDTHGNVTHLFERECSLQRRHQKILEESPSPTLRADTREQLFAAAVSAARAVNYVGAGTVEFVVGPDDGFYFLEMNTRLQVEHPVTEMVSGLDLVRLQLEIAQGGKIPECVASRGHAVEVRLYAEDPAKRFMPVAGKIERWEMGELPQGTRIDAGVETGSVVSVHYDPMLAKVIAWGRDRNEALTKISSVLDSLVVHGIRTNREFLRMLVKHPDVVGAKLSTAFVEAHASELSGAPAAGDQRLAFEIAEGWLAARASGKRILPSIPAGFRNNPFPHRGVSPIRVTEVSESGCAVEIDGIMRRAWLTECADVMHVQWSGNSVTVMKPTRYPRVERRIDGSGVQAPMTGKVMRVLARKGQTLKGGEPLVVLEAMKMEQTVNSSVPGVIERVCVVEGDLVQAGAPLVELSPS